MRLAGLFFALKRPRLLPIGAVAGKFSATALFPGIIRRADRIHFHFENRLHSFLYFSLRGLRRNLEDQRVLVFLDAEAFLGNHRLADDLVCRFHQATSAAFFERVRGLRADFFSCLLSPSTACFWRRDAEFFSDNCSFSMAGCEKIARS